MANLHHPRVFEAVIRVLMAIAEGLSHLEGGDNRTCLLVGYGSSAELIGPTYTKSEYRGGTIDLWMHDSFSRDLFKEWYGDDPPRTHEECDWRGADFLSRRMAHFVEQVARATDYTDYAYAVIQRPQQWDELAASAGFSSLPYWLEETRRKLCSADKRLRVFYFAAYYCATFAQRLCYALPANQYGWDVWVVGEFLSIPRTAALARADGYKGLICSATALLNADRDYTKDMIEKAKDILAQEGK